VHAAVQAGEVGQVVHEAQAAVPERVVQADLDVAVRVQCGDGRVQPRGVVVVEQQPHAHAPLGRPPQGLEQQVAGRVAVPDVVLHVERPLRMLGQQRTRREGVDRSRHRMDAGHAGLGSRQRANRSVQAACTGSLGRLHHGSFIK